MKDQGPWGLDLVRGVYSVEPAHLSLSQQLMTSSVNSENRGTVLGQHDVAHSEVVIQGKTFVVQRIQEGQKVKSVSPSYMIPRGKVGRTAYFLD